MDLALPKSCYPRAFMSGQSCAMQKIHQLSKEYGFAIIEDASHAIGGCYQDAQVLAACQYSDIAIFQFSSRQNSDHWQKVVLLQQIMLSLAQKDGITAQSWHNARSQY